MLNIVIPMAGAGSRFAKAGFKEPKPLIPINELPMIKLVIDNLKPERRHRYIFICQQDHIKEYGLEKKLSDWSPNSVIIGINGITEGAACTVLTARDLINNNEELMIANSDQYIDIDINKYLDYQAINDYDGLIMTMEACDPKWSYVGLNNSNQVIRVAEKKVISREATVGIYNFKNGCNFVSAAELMIKKNIRTNNEFYVAPVYNELISQQKKIGIFNIGKEADGMYGLGTPKDLEYFLFREMPLKIASSPK